MLHESYWNFVTASKLMLIFHTTLMLEGKKIPDKRLDVWGRLLRYFFPQGNWSHLNNINYIKVSCQSIFFHFVLFPADYNNQLFYNLNNVECEDFHCDKFRHKPQETVIQ